MLARVHSAATLGLEARVLDIEVDASDGLPRFTIVGLPDAGVREARDRVRSALRNAGFPVPVRGRSPSTSPRRTFASAAPPSTCRSALGLLGSAASRPGRPAARVFVGELGLGGQVRAVRGALCLALAARDAGFQQIVLPAASAPEACGDRRDRGHPRTRT